MNQRGQTLILMLVVTVVSLTIGVAISSRAVSTLKQTSYTAQAGKAQKFADSGAEEALGAADLSAEVGTHSIDVDSDGTNDVTYIVEELGGGAIVEVISERDQTTEIDLTGYGSGQAMNLYWVSGSGERASKAGLVLTFIYESGGEANLEKHAYDPEAVAHGNNFTVPSSAGPYTVGGKDYDYRAQINTPSGANRVLRIHSLYNNVSNSLTLQATGANSFPNQGYKVTSTGGYGEAEWTVEATKMNPALPSMFDYAIFSDTSLTK